MDGHALITLALLCSTFVLAACALISGIIALSKMRESRGTLKGQGVAIAGIVIGPIGILLAVILSVILLTG